jgi:hypothetical protein
MNKLAIAIPLLGPHLYLNASAQGGDGHDPA